MDPKKYTYPDDVLRDRVVLITGASDGIGRALALECARVGARVILQGRNSKKLEAVYDAIEALDGALRPSIAVMDLASADAAAYESLSDSLAGEFGRLDGLVHNAAILGERFAIEQYDGGLWQRVLHVNLTAPFALTRVCLPLLRAAPDPSLVFTTSGVGRSGRAFWGAYSVSKFGIEGLSQVLADEHRHGPLRVNCINPGATRTAMRLAAYPAEDRGRLKRPEEVLAPYIYLLGPDSVGVTGRSLDAQ
ncbi:MAG TPA: YciK family oxidoreductase [Woeseiaceae bacterium]|nr:YciK family oxidoreductase [Woeseiaceae bacterium]